MEIKLGNRAKQNIYTTYKNKAEVDKALHLLKEVVTLHESTHKFLSYFSFKGAKGVTQAKIETICETVGISTGTYHRTVKPDLDSFAEPLIITIPTRKKGKRHIRKGSKKVLTPTNVTGVPYKVLQPLSKIEQLVPKKNAEVFAQIKADFDKKIKGALERVTGAKERSK